MSTVHTNDTSLVTFPWLFLSLAFGFVAGCEKLAEVRSPDVSSSASAPQDFVPDGVPPEILFLGQTGIDTVGGSTDTPDGEPDSVVQMDLEPRLLKQIVDWEINTPLGYWTSKPNPNGWWLIKIVNDDGARPANGSLVRIKICFKGDPQISAFVLRALDAEGIPLFQYTVRK